MNVINRLMSILALLIVGVVAISTLLVVLGIVAPHTVGIEPHYLPLRQMLRDLGHIHHQTTRVVTAVVAGAVAVIVVIMLLLELRFRRRPRELLLSRDHDGQVTIPYRTLRKIAEEVSVQQADVSRAHCRVDSRGENLRVRGVITADPFANARSVGTGVESLVKSRLEHTVGRTVEDVQIKVELAEPGDRIRVR